MTHPFHTLCGREYDLVTYRSNWGEDRAYFNDDQGRLRSVPVDWTSLGSGDPFVVVSAGRAAFRVTDLLDLAILIDRLQEDHSDG